MSVMELPEVHECAAAGCSYNHEHACHAGAITISGSPHDATCGTFIDLGASGGLAKVVARVGACHRTDCVHNDELECSADAIRVGPGKDKADCLTYQMRV
ncbi:DUF1540 domain-containing protein [Mumia zhuanghuii]|uniref:DUF1540 domain-containing protein n=2 Tax=Mumia TaxID=1546255 RepID=A0ABW1QHA5_9ACTN|nr:MULTISPECIES: DUF1540 domain-containing protein [Mumia]KAA1422746.1 DUF1540 domain-containing protein [Mumia zhuanghuii]